MVGRRAPRHDHHDAITTTTPGPVRILASTDQRRMTVSVDRWIWREDGLGKDDTRVSLQVAKPFDAIDPETGERYIHSFTGEPYDDDDGPGMFARLTPDEAR